MYWNTTQIWQSFDVYSCYMSIYWLTFFHLLFGFLDENWSYIAAILLSLLLFSYWGDALPKSVSVVSNRIGMRLIWQDCSSSKYALYEVIVSRWWPGHPPAARCCICSSIYWLPEHVCIRSLYALQFMIHSTFVLVTHQLGAGLPVEENENGARIGYSKWWYPILVVQRSRCA